jgi:hypothetical protein
MCTALVAGTTMGTITTKITGTLTEAGAPRPTTL